MLIKTVARFKRGVIREGSPCLIHPPPLLLYTSPVQERCSTEREGSPVLSTPPTLYTITLPTASLLRIPNPILFQRQEYSSKVGIRNFSPHLRNSAILRISKSIAELRTKKSCGTTIADLQNLTSAIPQLCSLRQVPYFIIIFPELMML